MHFLLCIGGERYSGDTLKLGVHLARSLSADLSILYVRPRLSYQFLTEVRLARRKLEEWDLETPELGLIRSVQSMLTEEGYLRTINGGVDVRHRLKADIQGAFEYHLYGMQGENVRIRVRQGDVVDSIIRETSAIEHDLTIVGAPGDGGALVRHIIQYVETSVLIVKNPRPVSYRLLLCLDGSRSAQKAEDFVARAALLLGTSVDILCIHSQPAEEHAALEVAERARRLFTRAGVPNTVRLRRGSVERTILEEAEPDHIVVLGTSERSSLSQFVFGSTPVTVGRDGNNPVLVVK